MSFFNTSFAALILSLSLLTSFTNADELIANLNYGDTRKIVTKKLNASPAFKAKISSGLFGRVGLNGAFTTTNELANLKFKLYFDWNNSEGLKDVTFRSTPMPIASYSKKVQNSWAYAINLLSSIHGTATNAGEYPKKNTLQAGGIQYSHEWKTTNGYVYLGTGQESKGYNLVITFSSVALINRY